MTKGELRYGLSAAEVPEWMRSPHILRGYRMGGGAAECLRSLFRWHNETLNAWSMIAPTLVSAALLAWTLSQPEGPAGAAEAAPFVALHLSALLHAPVSVGYHLFCAISQEEHHRWRRLDSTFILGSSVLLAFALSTFVLPVWASLAVVTASLAVLVRGVKVAAEAGHGRPLDRFPQALLIGSAIAVYFFPMAVAAALRPAAFLAPTAVVFCSLAAGGLAYTLQLPERLAPGRFDIVGNSHHIMHLGVGAAHVAEWVFLWRALRGARAAAPGTPPSPS